MVSFSEDDQFNGCFDFQLRRVGPVIVYYQPEVLNSDILKLQQQLGYQVDRLDCMTWSSIKEMLEQIASALQFPDYFGKNFSALNDCLSDFEIPDQGGRLLVFERFDDFAKKYADAAQETLDIIARSSNYRMLFGKRFLLFVRSDDPRIRFDGLGGTSADWNPAEWLDSARGINGA
jgi:RNAse (barnase) inhibitor barstar